MKAQAVCLQRIGSRTSRTEKELEAEILLGYKNKYRIIALFTQELGN
jgi:hypothetical protein